MKVKTLKPGTKLMWDAPEPYKGYAERVYGRTDGRIMYPVIVTNERPRNESLECYIKTNHHGHWLAGEIEQLRFPTEEELNTLKWPEI